MNRLSWLARLAVGLILAMTAPAALASPSFPALTGKVVDEAGVLTPETEAALTEKITGLESRTGHQLVVVTVSSLQGLDIEEYGILIGRKWGVGRKSANDGVLLIIAPTQRKLRIEVGYGLESTLTDDKAAGIIAKDIVPKFKAGDINGGAIAGTDAIIKVIDGPPLSAPGGAGDGAAAAPLAGGGQPAAPPAAPPAPGGTPSLMTMILVAGVVALLVRMLGGGGKTQVVYTGDPNALAGLNGAPGGGGGGGAGGLLAGAAAGAGGMLLANRIRNGSWFGGGGGGGGGGSSGGGGGSGGGSGGGGYSGRGGGGGGSFGGGGASGSW